MYIQHKIRPGSVRYLEFLDGLSLRGIKYHHHGLIVIIIAAWYCESHNEKYIRFNALKVKCNEALKRLTKGEIQISYGSFASIIYSDKYKKFLAVKQVKVKSKKGTWITETRIYLHIAKIQEEIKSRKMENLDNGDERLAHIYNELDSIIRRRRIREPPVLISGSVTRQTSKARAPPIQFMSISDQVSISVTHANPKKGAKRHKHITAV